jgi:arsenate reductase
MTRGRIDVFSAGTAPQPEIHPMARQAIRDLLHLEMKDQYPKDLRLFEREHFDYVITVCDRAAEQCPVFAEDPDRIHWGFDDPAAVQGTDEQKQRAFDVVAKEIAGRVRVWMCLPAVRDVIESVSPPAPRP